MNRRTFLASLCASTYVGCTQKKSSLDEPIELVIHTDVTSLDPRFPSEIYSMRVHRLVYTPLIQPDPNTLKPLPYIASNIEHDEQAKEILVHLHRDVMFHDGTPLRAGDVVASWQTLRNPKIHGFMQQIVDQFQTVEALDGNDGYRVRFRLRHARATAISDLDVPILKASEASQPRGSRCTGSGPYQIERTIPGSVYLKPAPSFAQWSSSPNAQRSVVIRTVRDESTRALRVLAGATDVASNILSPALALALPNRHDAPHGLHVVRRPSASTVLLVINNERPPCNRLEVRSAIRACIPRNAILQTHLGGAATLASGVIPPIVQAAPLISMRVFEDALYAKKILQALQWQTPLTLLTSADRNRIRICHSIADSITRAGVPVEVYSMEFGIFYDRLRRGHFDLAFVPSGEISDPDIARWYLHSEAIPPHGANRGRVRDPEIDRCFDEGLATSNIEKRRSIYAALEQRIYESCAIIPLWHEDNVAVVSQRARGFVPSASGRWNALADL